MSDMDEAGVVAHSQSLGGDGGCSAFSMLGTNCLLLLAQVMQKDSEKNMSIKKLWK